MVVEIGPVSFESAAAWLSYARGLLNTFSELEDSPLESPVHEAFENLLDAWDQVERHDDSFHWLDDRPTDEIEFMIKGLFDVGTQVEELNRLGIMELRPPEADEYHLTLIQAVLAACEREGGSCGQFAEYLRHAWGLSGLI